MTGAPGVSARKESHLPQLDGLRAFAVTSVMVWHFGPTILQVFDLGRFGVLLFFVLSGFLISGILLDARDRLDRQGGSPGSVAGRFYARRFLRIFPIYYATILGLYALSHTGSFRGWDVLQPLRDQLGWFLTYTFNLRYGVTLEPGGLLSHVWSLCVEEQFYLVWPWIILFAPRRMILPALLTGVALGFGYRMLGNLSGWPYPPVNFMTPGCIDSLALGGLLAFLPRQGPIGVARANRLAQIGLIVGLILLVSLRRIPWAAARALTDVGFAGISVWLVKGAAAGFRGLAGRLLQSGPVVYMGKVSYGVYLYHIPVKAFLYIPLGVVGLKQEDFGWARPLVLMAAAIAMAVLSWELFEKRVNRLKRYVPYFDRVVASRQT